MNRREKDQITAASVCSFLPLTNGQTLLTMSDGLGILQICPVQQVQCCSEFDATVHRDCPHGKNDIISRLEQAMLGFKWKVSAGSVKPRRKRSDVSEVAASNSCHTGRKHTNVGGYINNSGCSLIHVR